MNRNRYPVSTMCRFFGVSRSGYYCFVKRVNKPEKHQQAVEKIAECQKKTNKTYGYRRVHEYLSTHDIGESLCCPLLRAITLTNNTTN